MPFHATTPELRLALLSLFSTGPLLLRDRSLCARILDRAVDAAANASPSAMQVPPTGATSVRFGAGRVLNSMCAACRECPRGDGFEVLADAEALPRSAA